MRFGETPVPIPNTTVKTKAAENTMLETAWEDRWVPDLYGGVAQLGEHLPCKQGVMSSNLTISTPCLTDAAQKFCFFAHVQARYKIEYLNSLMKTNFQQEFKHPILHRTLKTAY